MKIIFRNFIAVSLMLIIWQSIVVYWQIPAYLLPSPCRVFSVLYQEHQVILTNTLPTLIEISLGLTLGVILGCLMGFIITYFHPLRFWFWPLLIISQAIPTFAIAPLLVIWLGYGLASKISVIILMTFFPIASALYDGLNRTNSGWLDLANTMNARPWQIFFTIRLPAALPSLASGIRIAAVMAPVGAVVGEWVGSSSGLGYLMLNANARMQIDVMFAALVVIIGLALSLFFCVDKALHWWDYE